MNLPKLPLEETQTLTEGHKNGKKGYFRERCKCILLSSEGFKVKDLALIYKTRTRTIYTWIHNYQEYGFLGLKIQSGRGLKSTMQDLKPGQIEDIKAEILLNPQSLRDVAGQLLGIGKTATAARKYKFAYNSAHGGTF